MPTLPERIQGLLAVSPGLSDREITDTLFGHTANQQAVNQACRKLESRGILSRKQRADGRTGNYPRARGPMRAPTDHTSVAAEPDSRARQSLSGDSAEQRRAETVLVAGLARKLGVSLTKKRFHFSGGVSLEVDGACESPPIICEAWAHVGPAKVAQKHKLMSDAFKLVFTSRFLPPEARKILVLGDPDAARHLGGASWMAEALRANGVEIQIVEVPEDVKESLRRAQARQYR